VDTICLKIGENEPEDYVRFAQLSKHMDIVELLPRKRDEQGKRLDRGMGLRAEREYMGLAVAMEQYSDEEYEEMRARLTQPWIENLGEETENIVAKRLYMFDLSKAPWLSPARKNRIGELGTQKRAIKPAVYKAIQELGLSREEAAAYKKQLEDDLDTREVTDLHIIIAFPPFARAVVNKKTGETLDQELGV